MLILDGYAAQVSYTWVEDSRWQQGLCWEPSLSHEPSQYWIIWEREQHMLCFEVNCLLDSVVKRAQSLLAHLFQVQIDEITGQDKLHRSGKKDDYIGTFRVYNQKMLQKVGWPRIHSRGCYWTAIGQGQSDDELSSIRIDKRSSQESYSVQHGKLQV